MRIDELWRKGLMDSANAVKAALMQAGFAVEEIEVLLRPSVSVGRFHWTDDLRRQVEEMYVTGVPVPEIMAATGLRRAQIIGQVAKNGLLRPAKVTDAE